MSVVGSEAPAICALLGVPYLCAIAPLSSWANHRAKSAPFLVEPVSFGLVLDTFSCLHKALSGIFKSLLKTTVPFLLSQCSQKCHTPTPISKQPHPSLSPCLDACFLPSIFSFQCPVSAPLQILGCPAPSVPGPGRYLYTAPALERAGELCGKENPIHEQIRTRVFERK